MRSTIAISMLIFLAACGSSTSPSPTRYNFDVVDGRNRSVVAQVSAPETKVTSMLTRDPQGTFASKVLDFISPAVAYAQGIILSGTPVAGTIVCGRQAAIGEPQIVPLCAFTLTNGTAANSVVGGTKAGAYVMQFTAQVQSQTPVKDSTNFTVVAGPVDRAGGGVCNTDQPVCYLVSVNDVVDLHTHILVAFDQFANPIDINARIPGFAVRLRTEAAPLLPDGTGWSFAIASKYAGQKIMVYFFFDAFRGAFPMAVL